MALTTEQLCYINNLVYAESPSLYSGGNGGTRTVGDVVRLLDPAKNDDAFIKPEEWARMKEEILADPQLCRLEIKNGYHDKSTGDAGCLLVDPVTNEATIAFKGTGGNEWRDNAEGGTYTDNPRDNTITTQQQKALDYVEGLDLSGYDNVTVTGHSKGGNKAKLVALMNDEIDSCASFDGQGFSDEFMEAHRDDIAANQHKIVNHNVDGDFVNPLLNDIGETHYYEGQRLEQNLGRNHCPAVFFDNSGGLSECEQSEAMREMDYFLNSLLRSVDDDQKKDLLDFTGEMMHAALGRGGSTDKIMELISDPRYADELGYIVAYTIRYEQETGRITDVLPGVLEDCGLSQFNDIIDTARDVLNNDFICGLVKNVMKLGDDVPDWLIDMVRDKFDLDLTNDQIRQILNVCAHTAEYYEDIEIDPNAGADIKVPSTGGHGGGGRRFPPIPVASDILEDIFGGGNLGSGMDLFVHFAELEACCRKLQQAIDYYNEAIEMTRAAAEELAANWEGDAKDAFVSDQQEALRWYGGLRDVAAAVVDAIRQNSRRYSDTASRLADIMRG